MLPKNHMLSVFMCVYSCNSRTKQHSSSALEAWVDKNVWRRLWTKMPSSVFNLRTYCMSWKTAFIFFMKSCIWYWYQNLCLTWHLIRTSSLPASVTKPWEITQAGSLIVAWSVSRWSRWLSWEQCLGSGNTPWIARQSISTVHARIVTNSISHQDVT